MGRGDSAIVILGAGPTGLGAAYRLQELGHRDFIVLEGQSGPGGLAASVVDDKGFTWDMGGHVHFSHYSYYDRVLDRALGDDWLYHTRQSWNWARGRWVPYPFQNNIHLLDPAERDEAMSGLKAARKKKAGAPPRNYAEWILRTFGKGLAERYMFPYNRKAWGYPPEAMSAAWVGERVAVPDVRQLERNIRENRVQGAWGPNSRFRFPSRGGTGAVWKGVAALLDPGRIRYGKKAAGVDLNARRITLEDGEEVAFDRLLTTVPLDVFCGMCRSLSVRSRNLAKRLVHNSVHVLGVGLRSGMPEVLRERHWIYCPEPNSPYYRVSVFSNHSPHNVPPGDGYWSLMAEVSETPRKVVEAERLKSEALKALREDGLMTPEAEVVSYWHRRLDHGYPIPFIGRDETLDALRPELESKGVSSRGRFGGWKYEVSNQDHSFMQGVEWVNRLLRDEPETTYFDPPRANSGAFLRPPSAFTRY